MNASMYSNKRPMVGGFALLCPQAAHGVATPESHLNTAISPNFATVSVKQADAYRTSEWQGTLPGGSLMI